MRKKIFPRNKAHLVQAGFLHRFWAVAVDAVLVTMMALLLYCLFTEVVGLFGGEKGIFTQAAQAVREGKSITISLSSAEEDEEHFIIRGEGETFDFLREIIVGYIYFILFFHLRGRTPGKCLFRLKVIDLKGRDRVGWYQAFERTHGYAASLLIGGLGFFQVLWDPKGLTMHDKLAGTTVIKLPKKKKKRKRHVKKTTGRKKSASPPKMDSQVKSTSTI